MLNAAVIQGFVGSVLAARFDDSTTSPPFHVELWDLATSKFPFVAIAAPRGHAKSTAGTLAYGLAELLFRSSRFALIVSDTEAQATMFVGSIKQELQENKSLIDLFGLKKNEKGEVQFIKDTESDIIVQFIDGHTFRLIGKGAEQKLRGLNWNGTRPDLILIDDLENDELVMNKERRDKLRRWFRGALLPSLAPKGKIRMWGTILHTDSILENLMPREGDRYTRENDLKLWSDSPRLTMWKSVKYRAHDDKMTQFLWPERFNKDYFTVRREEYANNGMLDLYSQEYLNRPIDDSVAYFKRRDLSGITEDLKKKRLRFYCTADLAISQSETADYSAFVIAGVDEDKIIHVKHIIRERLDGKEIVDTILGIQRTYDIEAFGIEEMQVSKAIGPFLREEMLKTNTFINLVKLKHGGKDKIQRARSIQARMRARGVVFDKEADWWPNFEDEIIKFPRGKNDDQVDALAYMGLMLDNLVEAQTDKEVEEEEYEDERRDTSFTGRSAYTGY